MTRPALDEVPPRPRVIGLPAQTGADASHDPCGRGPLDDRACEAVWEFIDIEALCGEPAVGLFRRACIHEHVRDGWLCGDHAENRQNGFCRACFDLPGDLSHDCPISLAEVTA